MIKSYTLKQWRALMGICLLSFTLFLDVGIVANALPAIQKSLSANNVELQWVIAAFMLGLCAWMVIMGRLGDIFGLRKVFYINLCLFTLASLGAGLSQTIHELIIFRVLQGLTAAAAPLSPALISHNFSLESRHKAMAIFTVVTGFGLALGPIVGGFLIDLINWRWVFLINLPIVILGLLICGKAVVEAERNGHRESFDIIGSILWLAGISGIVIGLMQEVPIIVFIGFAALVAFIIFEFHKTHPLLNFQLLNNRIFISAALTSLIFGTFMATLLFLDPLYLQGILLFSATVSGLWLFVISAMVVLTAPVAGWVTHRYGVKAGTLTILFFTVVSAVCHYYFNVSVNIGLLLAAFISFGISWGFLNIAPVLAVTNQAEAKNTGAVMGTLWTFLNIGASVGLALAGILFRWQEKKSFIEHLIENQIPLNKGLYTLIETLLNEPEHIRQSLNELSPQFSSLIIPMYQQAFMHGFRSTLFFLALVSALAFILVIFIMREPSSQKID